MSNVDRFVRLLRYVRPDRRLFIVAFFCSGRVAALSAGYAWLVRPVLDGIFIEKNEGLLLILPLALLGIAVLKAFFSYGQTYLISYVGNRVITDIRQELFDRLMRLPIGFHDSNTSGRLVS